MNSRLHFLGIGAPKSGTTSLFHYMNEHPDVFMPAGKELPFFTNENSTGEKEWLEYYDQHFGEKLIGEKKVGKITPQYMNTPDIPERIAEYFPDIKMFAVLRNPIDRAYSYYAMKKRNGKEERTFDMVVEEQIKLKGDDIDSMYNSYLRRSKYGEILSYYLKFFSRDQIMIIFSDDLKNNPKKVVRQVFQFIGVNPDFVPSNLEKEYFVGGDRMRFKNLHKEAKNNILTRTVIKYLPLSFKKKIRHWYFNEFNVIKTKESIDKETRKRLIEYFSDDIQLLEEEFDIRTPWAEFKSVK